MDNMDLMKYWLESSNEDYNVMNLLHNSRKNSYCLFFGQMVIEKLLKAYYAKMNKNAPYAPRTHELAYLANKMNMKLNEKQEDMLETISDFNMEARYGDYKYKFDLKCTDVFDEQLNLKKLRRNIDYRIEPHLIEVADYDNVETPFVQEVINTGIKVA